MPLRSSTQPPLSILNCNWHLFFSFKSSGDPDWKSSSSGFQACHDASCSLPQSSRVLRSRKHHTGHSQGLGCLHEQPRVICRLRGSYLGAELRRWLMDGYTPVVAYNSSTFLLMSSHLHLGDYVFVYRSLRLLHT